MGVRDLVAAFNEEAGPLAKCNRATLRYETRELPDKEIEPPDKLADRPAVMRRLPPVQWQVITFYGSSGGKPFAVESGPLDPEADPVLASRKVAKEKFNPEKTEEKTNA